MTEATVKFETGKTYSTTFTCDSNLVAGYKVLKRTKCFITIEDIVRGDVKRVKVSEYDGAETCYPHGKYSMAICLSAKASASSSIKKQDDVKSSDNKASSKNRTIKNREVFIPVKQADFHMNYALFFDIYNTPDSYFDIISSVDLDNMPLKDILNMLNYSRESYGLYKSRVFREDGSIFCEGRTRDVWAKLRETFSV